MARAPARGDVANLRRSRHIYQRLPAASPACVRRIRAPLKAQSFSDAAASLPKVTRGRPINERVTSPEYYEYVRSHSPRIGCSRPGPPEVHQVRVNHCGSNPIVADERAQPRHRQNRFRELASQAALSVVEYHTTSLLELRDS
jgi:hypothetical protein